MSSVQAYRAAFDVTRLGAAHDWCRSAFDAALAEETPLVLVDNTNSRAAEYDYYRRRARCEGYALGVLELRCTGEGEARAFCRHGTHAVPWYVYVNMMRRWEGDASAVLLAAPAAPRE